ncbi:MAG: hypothetical protein ABWY05_18040 [Noviherbaspirillum sp.]
MLNIKDLASSKELGATEMSSVRGGSNYNVGNHNVAYSGGFASPAAVIAPVTQVDATSKIENTALQNFGGFQLAKVI